MRNKLFRRGRFVGLVNSDFHTEEKNERIWEKLNIPEI
jgi:hypothetical protein